MVLALAAMPMCDQGNYAAEFGSVTAVPSRGEHEPDVVLMDLRLPDKSRIEATRLIKELDPLTQVIILTGVDRQ